MKYVLRGIGWVALAALVWGVLSAPEQAAATLVDVGGGLGWVGDHVGVAMAAVAEHLPKS